MLLLLLIFAVFCFFVGSSCWLFLIRFNWDDVVLTALSASFSVEVAHFQRQLAPAVGLARYNNNNNNNNSNNNNNKNKGSVEPLPDRGNRVPGGLGDAQRALGPDLDLPKVFSDGTRPFGDLQKNRYLHFWDHPSPTPYTGLHRLKMAPWGP